jgi:hypothetical protein
MSVVKYDVGVVALEVETVVMYAGEVEDVA